MEIHDIQFSVSMCVYEKDNPEYFATAVKSILYQTISPTEIVLVVDGPVPEALEDVIRGFESNAVFHIIWLPYNQGHGNARRIGLRECQYDLVALMDADDISLPDRFEKQLKCFMEQKNVTIIGGEIEEFIDTPEVVIGKRIVPMLDQDIKQYMKRRCPMNQMTVMFIKTEIEQVGGYLDWYCNEDYYLWVRACLGGKTFYNLQEVLVQVRVGKDMYQRRGGWKYFKSEAKLQKYMWENGIISFIRFIYNSLLRFLVQVLFPNKLRGFLFQIFAREK